MRVVKDFAFGAFYLVSGIYSIGFGVFINLGARAVSGNPAFVTSPDGLFPFEVLLFVSFGLIFLVAAGLHFRTTIRSAS